jgi:DNA-directed RNA polymerase subunit RPC12/RpoP
MNRVQEIELECPYCDTKSLYKYDDDDYNIEEGDIGFICPKCKKHFIYVFYTEEIL